ncbi:(E2-independent) E3 ubiquitin-conjugating enzyme FATS isoform X2 [Denticeps clupeoides]|uniref:(E2-independent) E3 ubiquitin-conjugating enzyme FATS isoform X2 n=1 Tax=Denticeps clupeoides TaxID=299321 RepID=UPI0010A51129|nr:uncharacterized protein LOC114784769 isoform X2 [Denticeps clupeoides]
MKCVKPESGCNGYVRSRRLSPECYQEGVDQDLTLTEHMDQPSGWRRGDVDLSHWTDLNEETLKREAQYRQPTCQGLRPASCTEGGGKLDTWLQQLNKMWRRRHSGGGSMDDRDICVHMPPFSDRTMSMPVLHNEAMVPAGPSYHHPTRHSKDFTSGKSHSLTETPPGSTEALWSMESSGSTEMVHITKTHRVEQPRICSLTPVRIGWLPVQRRLMVNEIPRNGNHLQSDVQDGTCKVKLKPPITPILNRYQGKINGFGPSDGGVERSHARPIMANCTTPPWTPLGQDASSSSSEQVISRKLQASTEGAKDDTKNRSSGTQAPSRKVPIQRTQSLNNTTRPTTTQTRTGFSSISITSRKVTRSSSLTGSDNLSEPPRVRNTSGDMNASVVSLRRKAIMIKMTEHKVTTSSSSTGQGEGSLNGPQTVIDATVKNMPQMETVTLRKKTTVVKVTEQEQNYKHFQEPGHVKAQVRSKFRHSYSEGVQPNISNPYPSPLAPPDKPNTTPHFTRSVSMQYEEPPRNVPKLHRSTLCLYISPSSPKDSTADDKAPLQCRRPVSCDVSALVLQQPDFDTLSNPLPSKLEKKGFPQMINIDTVRSSANRWSASDTTSVRLQAGSPIQAKAVEGKPWPQAVNENQLPPGLHDRYGDIPLPAPDSALALSAATIIANIKCQRQLGRKEAVKRNSENETQGTPGRNTAAKDSGSDEQPQQNSLKEVSEGEHQWGLRRPHSEFILLTSNSDPQSNLFSLREALERRRPDFITHSEGRVRDLQRRAQERRASHNFHKNAQTASRNGGPGKEIAGPASPQRHRLRMR